ncbi:MAG: hypothetical protein LC099_04815 [Anaerolineales bacterium]|nr:hypothetical protein [Anaerolineales bacterium]
MFRVSVLELGFVCLVALALIIIPALVLRGQAQLKRRVKKMEERLAKKK